MISKIGLVTLALFLMPALANAGLIITNVATGSASGSISPTGSVYATAAKTYTITANTNYTLDYITNNAKKVSSGITNLDANHWTYTVPLSSTTQAVYFYFKVAAPANPPQLIAMVPANISAAVNTPITISGQQSTILYLAPGTKAKFKWTSAPAAVFNPISSSVVSPTSIVTSFSAAATGNYNATLTLTAPGATSSTANVTISVQSAGVIGSNACLSCHTGSAEANAYVNSIHATNNVTCQSCHNPTGTDSHPFSTSVTTTSCNGCHLNSNGEVPGHPFAIGSYYCTSCHDPHTTAASRMSTSLPPPHINPVTTGTYPASYVTPRSSCRDCHSTADNNAAIRNDWASSGHGDTSGLPWINDDFKIEDGCVRCHTTTGYVNYVTSDFMNVSAWGDLADKTKEVLACNGCHNPDFSRRSFNLVGPSGPSFTFSLPVSGTTVTDSYQFLSPISPNGIFNTDSNICMLCHRGTINGEIIKKATAFADFTSVGKLLPHGMAAAGMLGDLSGAGYNYNEDYYVFNGKSDLSRHWSYHEYIGSNNYHATGNNGACVTCHMSGTQHTFAAVFKNSTGSITGVTTQAICNNCHPSVTVAGPMDVTILKARKAGFAAALLVLKAQLQKSGFDPDSPDPKNWGETSHVRANNIGAYYNYFLLRDGDRASYVHGPAYTRRLILSSLTWLDDNTFNVSAYATMNTLASEERITAATRDSAISFLGITSTSGTLTGICANCHPGHSGSFNSY